MMLLSLGRTGASSLGRESEATISSGFQHVKFEFPLEHKGHTQ